MPSTELLIAAWRRLPRRRGQLARPLRRAQPRLMRPMANLLYLVHRLPYPPNKGDKVRSYHLLRHLAARHRVHLGTFIDDPDDAAHVDTLRALCAGLHVVARSHPRARAAAQPGRAARRRGADAALLPRRRPAALGRATPCAAHRIDARRRVLVADGAVRADRPGLPPLVDFVDVDSAKWTQYAGTRPLAAVVAVPARRRAAARASSATWRRARGARSSSPRRRPRCSAAWRPSAPRAVDAMRNGVDAEYFAPDAARARRRSRRTSAPIVFTGAMDYWPNVDAVTLVRARRAARDLRERCPTLRFHIVGRNPTPAVRALAGARRARHRHACPTCAPTCSTPRSWWRRCAWRAASRTRCSRPWRWAGRWSPRRSAPTAIGARTGVEIESAEGADGVRARGRCGSSTAQRGEAMGAAARAAIVPRALRWAPNCGAHRRAAGRRRERARHRPGGARARGAARDADEDGGLHRRTRPRACRAAAVR